MNPKYIFKLVNFILLFYLFSTYALAQFGESYETLKKEFGSGIHTGVNKNGDQFIYYDGEEFRYYYVFDKDSTCVKVIHFPVSYRVQRKFENELDILSKVKPKNYEKISSNKWRRKDYRGYVQILSGQYLAKSAFVITAIRVEED